jgi:ABC-2 type transport system ATP-binding protein/lipopolysaccharide transport system ATP-binding protein
MMASKSSIAIVLNNVSMRFKIPHLKHVKAFGRTLRRYEYSDLWALNNINLHIRAGETLGIIGENGSGKTTLLKIIGNIIEPTAGKCKVYGKIAPFLELGVGFEPELTARDNVYIYGAIMGIPHKELDRKFDAIIRFAELERFVDTKLKHFSSGMYMRLAFAVAISVDPDILLIDEVLAVGDIAFRQKCINKMLEFKAKGKTIVLVTHRLPDIKKVCDRLVLLHRGRIITTGTPEEVIKFYLTKVMRTPSMASEPSLEFRLPAVSSPPPSTKSAKPESDIRIVAVKFYDRAQRETNVFDTGEPIQVEISYVVNRPVSAVIFRVQIYRDDGMFCYGTSTYRDGINIDRLERSGTIKFTIRNLPLLGGVYAVNTAVWANDWDTPADSREFVDKIKVRSKKIKGTGIVWLDHDWMLTS